MWSIIRAVALLPLLALSAVAQTQGRGVLCDTADQVESFATLIATEKLSVQDAINKVNETATKPNACVAGAFIVKETSDEMQTVRDLDIGDLALSVKKVTVVAVWNGAHWTPLSEEFVQFTAVVRDTPVKPSGIRA